MPPTIIERPEIELAPLPPNVTIPDTVAELQVAWGDGEFWLALFKHRKRRWMGTVREDVARAKIEGLTMPPIGSSAQGRAIFRGPLEGYDCGEIQRANGDLVAFVDNPPVPSVRLYSSIDTLIVTITLHRDS